MLAEYHVHQLDAVRRLRALDLRHNDIVLLYRVVTGRAGTSENTEGATAPLLGTRLSRRVGASVATGCWVLTVREEPRLSSPVLQINSRRCVFPSAAGAALATPREMQPYSLVVDASFILQASNTRRSRRRNHTAQLASTGHPGRLCLHGRRREEP